MQILRAGFMRMSPSRHRSLPHLETAEIRHLHLWPGNGERVLGNEPQAVLKKF
jgi:hypothetical protein